MFESAELGQKVDDKTYAQRVRTLRADLLDAQYSLRECGEFPILILINGLDGAGKGETVNLLNEWMDPRHIETHAFPAPSDEERERPPMWRFWRVLPPKGKIGILFGNWHSDALVARISGKGEAGGKAALRATISDIRRFERMLTDEGVVLAKYWFHLSRKGQKARLKKLAANPRTAWRVTEHDWALYENYSRYVGAAAELLAETGAGHAPWTIIDGSDPNYRALAVGEHLLKLMRSRLAESRHSPPAKPARKSTKSEKPLARLNLLTALDLKAKVSNRVYERELEKWQGQLNQLSRHPKFNARSAVLVFEGMDAAGKGGAIRRITAALDARHYLTVPVAAPTEDERAQPYLWRFWRHLPRHGQFVIFDRSWYGRVLVERVENLCAENDWMRAYTEINEFERQLTDSGSIVSKFWLSISQEEQLRRFQEREQTRFKRFKITQEDWRNRDKWPLYEQAVCDMVERTSTQHAPWQLIAAEDKKHARITVLRTLCERIESGL